MRNKQHGASNRLCPRARRSVQNLLDCIGIRDRGFERKRLFTTLDYNT